MSFHPNLIAVYCANQDDMRKLAAIMREVCLKDTDKVEEYTASKTEEDAFKRAEPIKEDIVSSGHLRFILTPDGKKTNVVFTLQETETAWIWNLSVSHATPTGPLRVDDELANMIVGAFLEDNYEEVEPKAAFKAVRHFVKMAK